MRRALDFYETAPWQTEALADHLPELSGRVFCPCVGDGSIVAQLRRMRPDLEFVTNDIDHARQADYHFDATKRDIWSIVGEIDWVVDNPPFNVAFPIAQFAVARANKGVALMARISFVEGTRERGPWLHEHPRKLHLTLERYSFTGNGKSDSTTTEWLVWSREPLEYEGGFTIYDYKPRNGQRGLTL